LRSPPSDLSELERRAYDLIGRSLGEVVDVPHDEQQTVRTKGYVGAHVERYFGVAANSDAGPDLPHLGVELKAVPMRRLRSRDELRAKERTFITQINYRTVARQQLEGSPLDTKSRRTLYVFYEWERDRATAATPVLATFLHDRDEAAEDMIRTAHEHVQASVRAGEAHLLSEADTPGVGPATKGGGGVLVDQPYSDEPARPRAFAWRAAYTSEIYRSLGSAPVDVPGGFDHLLAEAHRQLSRHRGLTVAELRDLYQPTWSDGAKGLTGAVARRMLGSSSPANEPPEYRRYGLLVRAVRVRPRDGRPWESASFPAVSYEDVVEEPWESSPLVEHLRSILLVVFLDATKTVPSASLDRVHLWRPSEADIATMATEYAHFRRCIARSRPEDAPSEEETEILHLRPHGRDGSDLVPLPDGRLFRRSSFWLNKSYLQRVLS
jgi:DNA mismatch repair protein MutH